MSFHSPRSLPGRADTRSESGALLRAGLRLRLRKALHGALVHDRRVAAQEVSASPLLSSLAHLVEELVHLGAVGNLGVGLTLVRLVPTGCVTIHVS